MEDACAASSDDTSDDDGDVCGVDWESSLSNTQDEDDVVYSVDKDAEPGAKWKHIAAVVDSGAAENVIPAKRFLISLAPKIKATLFSSTNMFLVAGNPHVCLYCAQCICLVFPYLDKPKHVCLIPPPGPRLTWPRTELENRSLAAADISSRKHSKLGNRRKESQN